MPYGRVKSIEGDYAIVVIERQEMCGDCHACDMVHGSKNCILKCVNACKAEEGDEVDLELNPTTFLKATYILYGIPLVGLLGGVGIGYLLAKGLGDTWQELIMILTGLVGMVGGCFYIYKHEKKKKYQNMLPYITKIREL
ncbi:hypothetical protein CS063_07960 [Sporanaerobium hydrogeniformans]|uniref:Uncharacterized protein n=1 Tax=Sporanaerobium hydrogeniformans TaxID=3072179 RepID=A0AC61DDP0_9FIRM|nr:SoxR reducing system RseC family protein [Sporanaerobium hydrogeniformans]PHV70945.1 hypothetical protein CS063_07960 [Sporanaerobium hydrogeniformans]